jgi:hypothetical protein
LVEKCCLLVAAKESFQDAENDLKVLTGIEVGYSTYHRQVKKVDLSPPKVKQKLTEVCLEVLRGGKSVVTLSRERKACILEGV